MGLRPRLRLLPIGVGPSARSASGRRDRPLRRDPVHARELGWPWCLDLGRFCCCGLLQGWPAGLWAPACRGLPPGMCSASAPWPRRCRWWPISYALPSCLFPRPFLGGGSQRGLLRPTLFSLTVLGSSPLANLRSERLANPAAVTSRCHHAAFGSWLWC